MFEVPINGTVGFNRKLWRSQKGADGSGYEENPDYEKMPDIEATREEYDIIAWDMDPGDVIAFHGMTVHKSWRKL